MKWNYKAFHYLESPVYLNISVVFVFIYFVIRQGVGDGVLMAVSFLFLMLVHEMGHAWFVRKYGHALVEVKIYPVHGCCRYRYDSNFEIEALVYAGGLRKRFAQFLRLKVRSRKRKTKEKKPQRMWMI